MKLSIKLSVIALAFSVGTFAVGALAQEVKEPTPTALPKSGSLGSSMVGGFGGAGAAGQWATGTDGGKEVAPISGSVSRVSDREWLGRIFNNSQDSYSASVELEQYNERGGKVKGDYFSVSLKPGESVERRASAAAGSRNANLQLRSWKKTSKTVAPQATATASAQ